MNNQNYIFDSELCEKAKVLVMADCEMEKRVPQSVYLIEEMSELTKEITKEQRFKGDRNHVKEEVADVLCTILTYSTSINIDFEEIRNIMLKKLNRGIDRLANNEQ
ncbi:MAG: hypothetical protein NC347_03935 [Clostridium sp.]|nr:hypothetical protein [Clostridium sp.]